MKPKPCQCKHDNASVQKLLTILKSREENPEHQWETQELLETKFLKKKWEWSAKAKPIFAKPNSKADLTTYLIDVVLDGRLWYN